MTLSNTEIEWDNKAVTYDLEKYNWPAWALSVIQEVAPNVTELETIHEVLTPVLNFAVPKKGLYVWES